MRVVSISEIEKVQEKVQKRADRLLAELGGKPVSETDELMHGVTVPSRWVNNSEVREAVEEFMVTLRELKATIGKR